MEWGVIAFIDALGFKGIWKAHDPKDVLASIESIKSLAATLKAKIERLDGWDLWDHVSVRTYMFSDTVGIAINLPPPKIEMEDIEYYQGVRQYMLLRHVVMMVSEVTGEAAISKVPLLYRGCISTGEFTCNDTSLVGPAVDEAGEYFEECDGAFVFLTPSAEKTFTQRPWQLRIGHPAYFVPYSVPMKKGKELRTLTVNPLLFLEKGKKQVAIESIISCFGGTATRPASVHSKALNTEAYLKHLLSWQW